MDADKRPHLMQFCTADSSGGCFPRTKAVGSPRAGKLEWLVVACSEAFSQHPYVWQTVGS